MSSRFLVGVVLCVWMSPLLSSQEVLHPQSTEWAHLPDGRVFGSSTGMEIGSDGSIWIAERCGSPTTCVGSKRPPILHFDSSGKLLSSFGTGLFVSPHGTHLDREGNLWVTDDMSASGIGFQVFKFAPTGKLLLRLGTAGTGGNDQNTFNRPTDVVTAPNGDIFVADGHGGDSNARIVKFSKDGKFVKAWGRKASGPGEFDNPHSIVIDSQGRLIVDDNNNNRLEVFDQNGMFLTEWRQFGRVTSLFITPDDVLYATSGNTVRDPLASGTTPGIRIGSAREGALRAFFPLEGDAKQNIESAVADGNGNVYAADMEKGLIRKYRLR